MRKMMYPVKDKHIRIYQEIEDDNGVTRVYQHPEGTFIHAYVKQASMRELDIEGGAKDLSDVMFVVNHRNSIKQDMIVEFIGNGKTYKIGVVDYLEFYNGEVKFYGNEITPKEPDYIEYKEWMK